LYPCKIDLENWHRKAPRSSWENRWKIRAIDFPLGKPIHWCDRSLPHSISMSWTWKTFGRNGPLHHFDGIISNGETHGFQLCQFTGNPELERARIISWQWKFPGLNGGF
jgi:hypothetical protein